MNRSHIGASSGAKNYLLIAFYYLLLDTYVISRLVLARPKWHLLIDNRHL